MTEIPILDAHPITRRLLAVVHPTPAPARRLVATADTLDGSLLVIHPGSLAEEVLYAVIDALWPHHPGLLRQWLDMWGHAHVPLEAFVRDPWRYAQHQRRLVVDSQLVIPRQAWPDTA